MQINTPCLPAGRHRFLDTKAKNKDTKKARKPTNSTEYTFKKTKDRSKTPKTKPKQIA